MSAALSGKDWFERADHFHYTSLFLLQQPAPMYGIYGYPHIVMKAFAAEAFLKSLLTIEGKGVPHIHDLLKLFDKLSQESRREIQRRWDTGSASQLRNMRAQVTPGLRVPKNMRDALDQSSNAFLDWRYHPKGSKIAFTVMSFPHYVRCRILELEPSWAHTPPHPLASLNPDDEDRRAIG